VCLSTVGYYCVGARCVLVLSAPCQVLASHFIDSESGSARDLGCCVLVLLFDFLHYYMFGYYLMSEASSPDTPKSPKSPISSASPNSVVGSGLDGFTKLSDLDFGNPLYLHPSDTSNTSVINIKLKGTENYNIWANAMELALQVKNKLGFIDGSVLKDSENDVLVGQWDRCNSVVLSWILNSGFEDLYVGQIFSKVAKDVWDELRETYSKVDGSVIYSLYKQINSTT
jgi:hypothetical protein